MTVSVSDPATVTATATARQFEASDSDLLGLVHSLPKGDARRDTACEQLTRRYQSLVRSCAARYRHSPESQEELMQVGYVGLLKAINNFDPSLGTNLAAYALPCISGEIKRHFRDKRWQVRVKRSVQDLRLELRQAQAQLTQDLARAPSDAELASHLGVSEDELHDAQRAEVLFQGASIDAPLSDGSDPSSLADLLGADDPQLEHTLDMEAVRVHWPQLPPRQQRMLTMRFYGNMTQAEIGEKLGISQMHVSRLLASSLAYLRDCVLGTAVPSAEAGER